MKTTLFNTGKIFAKAESKVAEIEELDFTLLKCKLMDAEDGEGWDIEQCDEAEILYKRFLCLLLLFPDEQFAPSKTIDIFWHHHILDTQSYVNDTEMIFGRYLHHYPYMGLFEADREVLDKLYGKTKSRYQEIFGEDLPQATDLKNEIVAGCKSNCAGRCRN